MNFDIGEIPKGWSRGRELMVQNPPKDGYGYLMQAVRLQNEGFGPDDIAMVTFGAEDIDKVNAWLKWWRE